MKEKMQHRQDEEKQDLTKMWKLFHKNGKKKKNTKNREFAVVTYSFLGLFLCLMGYFVYFEQVESEQFINNPYNKRQELFTRSVVRGSIYSADGVTHWRRRLRMQREMRRESIRRAGSLRMLSDIPHTVLPALRRWRISICCAPTFCIWRRRSVRSRERKIRGTVSQRR